jgi:flagellar hook protein FlgE
MPSSFYTALSGMRAHQQWIDVIGNNLANQNTPGYKFSRATFAESFVQTLRNASEPTSSRGGIDPMQIGYGVHLSSVDRTFTQGALSETGRIFDLALDGNGFFALSDGSSRFYSRVGTFGVDKSQNLVDQSNGLRVLDPTGQPVTVDSTSLFPPRATDALELQGNLPAVITGPLNEVLTANSAYRTGTRATLSSTGTSANYATGVPNQVFTMEVIVNDGAPQQVSVQADSTGVLAATSIASALNALVDVSASIGTSGEIVMNTDLKGADVSIDVNPGVGNDLAALIGLPTSLTTGSEADVPPDLAVDLNQLTRNLTEYTSGDEIEITGVDTDGTAINATFVYGVDGTQLSEFVDYLDGLYADAEVRVDNGQLVIEAETAGEAEIVLALNDATANTGRTQWSDYAMSVTTDGADPDTVVTSTEVYDGAGIAHTVTLRFERQADLTWNLVAELNSTEGSILAGGEASPITGIAFGPDGSPTGLGSVASNLRVQFTGQPAQDVAIDLGLDGSFEGLTQFGSAGTAFVADQNGYGDGELSSISVSGQGHISGFYTNGQSRELARIGVATFQNDEGLRDEGTNLFAQSTNSGDARLGEGELQNAGSIVSGALENSNVDTAEQFVRLIEAQRGFQANARVVTTQDEVLAETVNLI